MIGLDVILGGVTGLLGNAVTAFMNLKTMKEKNKHEETMVGLESEAMKLEAEMNIAVKKAEVEGAVELADSDAYMESIKLGNEKSFSDQWISQLFAVEGWMKYLSMPAGIFIATMFGLLDFLKGFMRPGLTAYLTGMSTYITYLAWEIMQKHGIETMTSTDAVNIYNQTTSIIIYLTVSCVTWWFADRRTGKFVQDIYKNNQKN